MIGIADAPWIRDPEAYADDYYGGCYEDEDWEEADEDSVFRPVVMAWLLA